MKRTRQTRAIAATAAAIMLTTGAAAAASGLNVAVGGLGPDGRLPDWAAFCPKNDAEEHNISPPVSWSAGPSGTRSYALVMIDPDVPQDVGLINKPGVTIPKDAPRIGVFHWVLADIPAGVTALARGAESEGFVRHGKPVGETPHGRRGANVYTRFFTGNREMAGTYGGYDGPCPPVNDMRVHRYIVKVFALDIPSLELSGAFDGEALELAMKGHVLASGEAVAAYTLNP